MITEKKTLEKTYFTYATAHMPPVLLQCSLGIEKNIISLQIKYDCNNVQQPHTQKTGG